MVRRDRIAEAHMSTDITVTRRNFPYYLQNQDQDSFTAQ